MGHIDLRPETLGFDLRELKSGILVLPDTTEGIEVVYRDLDGTERVSLGTPRQVASALRASGINVAIEGEARLGELH